MGELFFAEEAGVEAVGVVSGKDGKGGEEALLFYEFAEVLLKRALVVAKSHYIRPVFFNRTPIAKLYVSGNSLICQALRTECGDALCHRMLRRVLLEALDSSVLCDGDNEPISQSFCFPQQKQVAVVKSIEGPEH